MFEPEISRRCLSCGASVRQSASFCPQCGQILGQRPLDEEVDPQTEPTERQLDTVIDVAESPTEALPVTPEPQPDSAVTQAIIMPEDGRHSVADSPSEAIPIASDPQPDSAVTQAIIMPEDGRHSVPMMAETQPLITQTIRREQTVSEADVAIRPPSDTAPPETEHHLMDRVARIREVSSVVIDQAAYDPSLRFLLVAAVLFVLFVILMVLSKVIG